MSNTDNRILGLRTVIYKVWDLAEAKIWYTNVFDTAPYFDEEYYVGFNIGGYELGLQPAERPASDKQTSVVTYWGVNDMTSAYDYFIASGAETHEPPQEVGGGIVVASLKDPWDNIVGLIYNPHFSIS